ncbi:MAG: Fic family protein [Prosthecobacter sp.]|jgi:Fic family protein|uniref:Fic family protein n=1 Tax=Prosthecobacter sp. TaxID=1965333 RepID=UPI001A0A1056|nr:Fic family protein [Prosthecobacter sp.]MBE2283973.1 Fic family protein [Prosthecobacter sp.]
MASLSPLPLADLSALESAQVWRALRDAHRWLAELKGLCAYLPNPALLLETLAIQEAKDSSEIENIITTHDELYAAHGQSGTPAANEVQNYMAALRTGYEAVRGSGLIRLETVLAVQAELEQNRAGLRKLPGTVLKNEATGRVIYEPPQDAAEVESLMGNLIDYIHADDGLDPLLRMAVVHHQFESIHPFYDGNGRTGRILNILLLIREDLLELPLLYLSRYINQNKAAYYELLQTVREQNRRAEWCLYMLKGVAQTARSEIQLIKALRDLMLDYKHRLRTELPKLYSQDLLNNLFRHPYTKIEFIEKELGVSRPTAMKYLDQLTQAGFVEKAKISRSNFYINRPLYHLLTTIQLPSS